MRHPPYNDVPGANVLTVNVRLSAGACYALAAVGATGFAFMVRAPAALKAIGGSACGGWPHWFYRM
jgi:hypothetical protein